MSPRRRLRKNKDLPDNVYPHQSKGITYYRYKHPKTGKMHSLGSNKAEALRNARVLNTHLIETTDKASEILKPAVTLSRLIKRYETEFLPKKHEKKRHSQKTKDNYRRWLDRLKSDECNEWIVADATTEDVAEYLDENFINDSYKRHRAIMLELFQFAQNKGYREINPVEPTMTLSPDPKKRQRLTIEQFKAIHEAAPDWMKIAMELGLLTLQGRNEVLNMKFSDVKDDLLYVTRKKTEKNEWAHLRIKMNPSLKSLRTRARNSGIASPYFVHREPERRVKAEERDHWTQLTLNDFSKRFRELRNSTGLFDHLDPYERPSFHEIRSLGSWLYEKQGFNDDDYVQRLMAHADKKTTEYYQSGHETKWMDVEAGLDMQAAFKTK